MTFTSTFSLSFFFHFKTVGTDFVLRLFRFRVILLRHYFYFKVNKSSKKTYIKNFSLHVQAGHVKLIKKKINLSFRDKYLHMGHSGMEYHR